MISRLAIISAMLLLVVLCQAEDGIDSGEESSAPEETVRYADQLINLFLF